MKRNYFLFVLNVCAGFIIAQSPITLGNSNMPGGNDTLRFTNFQVNSAGNYTQTGTNFSWNFSSLVSTSEGIRSFKSALQTPYAFFFLSTSAYGEKLADTIGAGPLTLTNYYNFYKKQTSPNAFIADGVGMTYSSLPIPSYYSDKDELYMFPMTYPKYDSTTFKFTTSTGGFIPVNYSKVGYRVTVVDGWGTVTTPYGTENCLRLITTQYAMDSIKNTIIPIPLGFPNYQRSYQWLTLNSKIPFVEITGNLVGGTFTPTQSRYRGYAKESTPTSLNEEELQKVILYPNPVKDKLNIEGFVTSNLSYEIFASDGKRVKTFNPASFALESQVDVSTLAAGIYFLKITDDQTKKYLKFIKE
ncbi:hypothetical protein CNR22_17590 [Sphingobacteriaceae bacterium]|nr:hypothetical protein CNR22_17590 [Sphingobacteriaceae bacterium]